MRNSAQIFFSIACRRSVFHLRKVGLDVQLSYHLFDHGGAPFRIRITPAEGRGGGGGGGAVINLRM